MKVNHSFLANKISELPHHYFSFENQQEAPAVDPATVGFSHFSNFKPKRNLAAKARSQLSRIHGQHGIILRNSIEAPPTYSATGMILTSKNTQLGNRNGSSLRSESRLISLQQDYVVDEGTVLPTLVNLAGEKSAEARRATLIGEKTGRDLQLSLEEQDGINMLHRMSDD